MVMAKKWYDGLKYEVMETFFCKKATHVCNIGFQLYADSGSGFQRIDFSLNSNIPVEKPLVKLQYTRGEVVLNDRACLVGENGSGQYESLTSKSS